MSTRSTLASNVAWCDVCDLPLDEEDYRDEWLTCAHCFVNVHTECYHGAEHTEKKEWLCDCCESGSTQSCSLCTRANGALKQIHRGGAGAGPAANTPVAAEASTVTSPSKQPAEPSRETKAPGWDAILGQASQMVVPADCGWAHISCTARVRDPLRCVIITYCWSCL